MPHQGAVLNILDDRGVLFVEAEQEVYLLDAPAATVWEGLWVQGASRNAVALQLSVETGCSHQEAAAYVAACLADWEHSGLLAPPYAEQRLDRPSIAPRPSRPIVLHQETDVICLAGVRVAISYPDAYVARAIRDMLGHLVSTDEVVSDYTLVIHCVPEGYAMDTPDGEVRILADPAAAAVWLKMDLLDIVLSMQPQAIALHAAALQSQAGVVLLAGSSGSGKTTLAAVLNAQGWPSIADDVVLIRENSSAISGLPLAYAAKPGSWPVLRRWFAEVDELPAYSRPDGRIVKYIHPREVVETEDTSIAAVVFPRYNPAQSVRIEPVDKVSALVDLLKEARNAHRRLSRSGFLRLSTILRQSAVLSLVYSDASHAAAAIGQYLGQTRAR